MLPFIEVWSILSTNMKSRNFKSFCTTRLYFPWPIWWKSPWAAGALHYEMDIGVRLRLPNTAAFGESEEKKVRGIRWEQAKMSQNYQKVPKLCDLSMIIAPDLKENKIKNWVSFGIKISIFLKNWRLWVTAHNFVKTMRSLGEIVKIYVVFGWGRC